MENKFKKGLILGGLLAVGAVVGFAMNKQGQELSEELQKDLKTLAKHLKKKLHQLEDATKDGFDQLVSTVVDEYAKENKLASGAQKILITALKEKWQEMEEEYLEEKEGEKKKKK
ncbi:MAG: hypothetical protein WC244_02250 [Patescibacteria group bacterium]|jgi:predicted PurR-regulated permease PerM